MRLQSLKIRNFRPFTAKEATPFDLDHSVVLLYGGNGSGKSSFFDALELALIGTVKRLERYDRPSRLLINARHPNEPAELYLQWLNGSKSRELEISIANKGVQSKWSAALGGHQLHLFQHTTYLLQSDIRRLLTAGSSSLGEIIEKLIVDEDVDLLIRGLAEANITRNDASYQRSKYEIEQLSIEAEKAAQEIEGQKRTITSIQENRVSLGEVTTKLRDVGRALGLESPNRVVSSLEQVRDIAKELDRLLQRQMRVALETQAAAERALGQANSLGIEQNESQSTEQELRQSDAARQGAEKDLADVRKDIQSARKELEKSQSEISSRSEIPAIVQILSACSDLEDLDVCPICDRPFPNLKEHIHQKLSKLNKEQTAFQKTLTDVQARLRRLQNQEMNLGTSLERDKRQTTLLRQQIESAQKRLQSFVSKYKDQLEKVTNLKAIEVYERRRFESARKEYERLTKLTETLLQLQSEALAGTSGLSERQDGLRTLERREKELSERLRAKKSAFDRLDAFIDAMHDARGKLSDRIEKLLNEFVQGRTRMAFEDLFRRIARHPYFQVTIPVSRVKYHKPEVNWVATYRGQQLPGDAVFSQGQLNACALSFFLALATTQPKHLGFLLLDDPVQSMDEIHIEEFATVLKVIKDLLGWQLILAVHEESLFNYLKRILYPSEPGQSLIAYQLASAQDGPEIQSKGVFEFDSKVFSLSSADSAA
jgi:exonuclease SbcC